MNTQTNGLFNQNNAKKDILVNNQKEIVSFQSKAFTAADLWNIQRQGKNRMQRRFM